jgi:5,5'-dehydrodivanillate O-demethylase oxygenase subunit
MTSAERLRFPDLEPVGPKTPTGRYLRMFWQPLIRAQDVGPGQVKPVEMLGEMFTVYRGKGGEPHVVEYRCAHRGSPLSLGWVEDDDIRCRYHGWKFDQEGRCNEQPAEEKPFCEKIRIKAYPCREYANLIFAYLGEGSAPAFRNYPDFDRPGTIVADPVEVLPCTFWNKMDNDHAHVPWVHRATALRKGRADYLVIRKEEVEETPYGYISTRKVDGQPVDFRDTAYFFMPNARQFWAPTRAKGFEGRNLGDTKMTWTLPINDAKFASFDVTHTPLTGEEGRRYAESRRQQEDESESRWDIAEKIIAGEMKPEDLPAELSAYTAFSIEDYVTQVGQGSIAARTQEHLGRTDVKVTLLRRLWLREVGAMLSERPLTDWKIPTRPFTDALADRALKTAETQER